MGHLAYELADLARLPPYCLRQDHRQHLRVLRAQSAADRGSVRAGGARGVDVVVREHEGVREQLREAREGTRERVMRPPRRGLVSAVAGVSGARGGVRAGALTSIICWCKKEQWRVPRMTMFLGVPC